MTESAQLLEPGEHVDLDNGMTVTRLEHRDDIFNVTTGLGESISFDSESIEILAELAGFSVERDW